MEELFERLLQRIFLETSQFLLEEIFPFSEREAVSFIAILEYQFSTEHIGSINGEKS
jgi:hypothetical protein